MWSVCGNRGLLCTEISRLAGFSCCRKRGFETNMITSTHGCEGGLRRPGRRSSEQRSGDWKELRLRPIVPRGTECRPLAGRPFVVGSCLGRAAIASRGGSRRQRPDRQTVAACKASVARRGALGRWAGRPEPVALRAQGPRDRRRSSSFGTEIAAVPARQVGSDGSRRPGNEMSPVTEIARCSLGDRCDQQAGSVGDTTGCGSDPARGGASPRGLRVAPQERQPTGRSTYRPGVRREGWPDPDGRPVRAEERKARRVAPSRRMLRAGQRCQGATPEPYRSGRRQASWAPRPRTWRLLSF
jgi:hypothetical protein